MIRSKLCIFLFIGFWTCSNAQPCFDLIDTNFYTFGFTGQIKDSSYSLYGVDEVFNGLYLFKRVEKNLLGETVRVQAMNDYPDFLFKPVQIKLDSLDFIEVLQLTRDANSLSSPQIITIDFSIQDTSSIVIEQSQGYDFEFFRSGLVEKDSSLFHLVSYSHNNSEFGDLYWRTYSLNGELMKERLIIPNEYIYVGEIQKSPDGHYLLSFSFRNEASGINFRDIGMMKIKANGEILWRRDENISGSGNQDAYLTKLPDQSFLNLKNTPAGYVCKKIDLNGKILRNILLPNDFYYPTGGVFYVYENGAFVLPFDYINPVNGTHHPAIAKYNPLGDLLWTKYYEYNPNRHEYLYSYDLTPDKGIMMAGYTIDSSENQRGWFMKTNCLGEVTNDPVDCNTFDCEDYPIDASFTTSDTLIDLSYESGTVYFENNSPNATSYLWNFKTGADYATRATPYHTFTENGVYRVELDVYVGKCHETAFQDVYVTNALSLDERSYDQNSFRLFPNPSHGKAVTIEGDKTLMVGYQLCNGQGAVVGQESFATPQKKSELTTEGLSKGVYFVRLNLINGQQLTKKLIVD